MSFMQFIYHIIEFSTKDVKQIRMMKKNVLIVVIVAIKGGLIVIVCAAVVAKRIMNVEASAQIRKTQQLLFYDLTLNQRSEILK